MCFFLKTYQENAPTYAKRRNGVNWSTIGRMMLFVATVSQVEGRTDAVPKTHMQNAFAAKFTSASQGVSSRLLRLLNAVASDVHPNPDPDPDLTLTLTLTLTQS